MSWENNFTDAQFASLRNLIEDMKSKYDIEKIIGHYEVEPTKECPSFNVPQWLEENGLV